MSSKFNRSAIMIVNNGNNSSPLLVIMHVSLVLCQFHEAPACKSASIVSKPNDNINAMKAGRHAFQALFTYKIVCTPFEDCLCISYLCVNVIYTIM